MTRHLLLGPTAQSFADEYLSIARAAGSALTFGPTAKVHTGPAEDGDAFIGCSVGWVPDLAALWLPAGAVPPAIWDAGVPVFGLAAGWDLRWHACRRAADRC